MRSCRFLSVCVLLSLVSIAGAQTAAPSDVHVKLSLADKKTVYRIGEPIKLVLEFTGDREGYLVEYMPDNKQPGLDTIVISPETGVAYWLNDLNDNRGYARHTFATDKLTSSPKRVEFFLNDTVRFDSPGSYTVHVITRRIWKASASNGVEERLRLTTNSITFDVQAMSDTDEAKEVKRLTDLLVARRDPRSDDELARQLSYLTGDPSTREKVRRFIHPEERGGNYGWHIWYGLYIARNRSLTLKLVETAMWDPNVPVTFQMLNVATRLKTLLTHGVREKPAESTPALDRTENPRSIEIRDAYVVELAAGLGKRTGNSQTTTAMTVLMCLPKDSQSASAGLREVRRILLQQFDTLHPYSQEYLLRQYWDQLRDPALVPALKKMLVGSDSRLKQVREGALRRLHELAPDAARPYFIAEIRDPNSFIDPKLLGALPDESLPELDTPLLEQIRTLAGSPANRSIVLLKFKTVLLARFATASIYQQVMELYESVGVRFAVDARAGLLAYLARHNDREAMPLIEQAVSELKPGEHPMILSDLTALYYSESIGALLKKLLETDDAPLASSAAYLIGLHGSASDQRVLEDRLKRWREQWRNSVVEADAQHKGQIERALILALTGGKSWKLSPDRERELQMSCITNLCKEYFSRVQ